MKKLAIIILVLFFVGSAMGQEDRVNLPQSENYYKPYKRPLPFAYGYLDLGLSRELYDLDCPLGGSLRVGFVRAFKMNKYVWDIDEGYLGKKNKLYGQFSAGWIRHVVYGKEYGGLSTGGYYYGPSYAGHVYSGLDLGIGLAMNVFNKFALESNFHLVPLPALKKQNEMGELEKMPFADVSKKRTMMLSFGLRMRRFGVFYNLSNFTYATENSEYTYILTGISVRFFLKFH